MLLARAAVIEPDLLLLDEPTNHLDIGRIGVLERFLDALPRDCAVVAASHDRAFLDDVTNRTLFLRPEKSADFSLPYSRALEALEERDMARHRQFRNDMRKVRALRQQAAKLKNIGINSGSDLLVVKTKQLSERADKLEERARPAHQERLAGAIRLTNSGTHAKALVTIDDAAIATPDGRLLFRTGRLWIENGDRVALLGANGTGKTRFVERLRAALAGSDPDIRGAASLKPGHSDQALSQLDAFATPWDAVKRSSDLTDPQARAQLAGAGVSIDAQAAPVARLSGGQRARLAMLILRLVQPNFYLLDEPTNHLDIEGQDMLEGELIEHGAACLLTSHDRAFVRAVATRIWVITGKRLVEVDDPDPVFDRLMSG
jgi:ATPase subunit of ABC transporter with duplicated ATPase domains